MFIFVFINTLVYFYRKYLFLAATRRRYEIIALCHPGGIFAVVDTAIASNCKDSYPNGGQNDLRNLRVLCLPAHWRGAYFENFVFNLIGSAHGKAKS